MEVFGCYRDYQKPKKSKRWEKRTGAHGQCMVTSHPRIEVKQRFSPVTLRYTVLYLAKIYFFSGGLG